MTKNQLKKTEPATRKSSGTDDPNKYIGKWEEYTEPQGINAQHGKKVSATEAVFTWNQKRVLWSDGEYFIAVNNPEAASYATLWTADNQKVGFVSTRNIADYPDWLAIDTAEIEPKHRRNRMGMRMYQVLIQYMEDRYKGLISYLPDVRNPKHINVMHRRLGGMPDPENTDVVKFPRQQFFENAFGPTGPSRFGAAKPENTDIFTPGAAEKKLIRKSRKPDMATVKKSTKAMVAKGQKPTIRVDETIRIPFAGKLSAEFEIINDDDQPIGFARVEEGIIEVLDYLTEADIEYRGQILSALMHQITSEADSNRANLSIWVGQSLIEVKSLLERFGFRATQGGIMKRTAGSIRPPSVNPPQGMGNIG